MVGPTGFEPATPSPPAKCATRLRYGPTQKKRKMAQLMHGSSLYTIGRSKLLEMLCQSLILDQLGDMCSGQSLQILGLYLSV
jgi:hypothetical protein